MLRFINSFIYHRILNEEMPNPDIPCYLSESYGQCYEDVILDGLVRSYLIRKNLNVSDLTYLDIGANHPIATSNTYLLNIYHGISGILVEANPDLIPALKKFRPYDQILNAAVTNNNEDKINFFVSKKSELSSLSLDFIKEWKDEEETKEIIIPTIRIMSLLKTLMHKHIILSIDVEGFDLEVLKDINFLEVKPFAIVIEHNDHKNKNIGIQMIELLKKFDYHLYSKTNVNMIFSIF